MIRISTILDVDIKEEVKVFGIHLKIFNDRVFIYYYNYTVIVYYKILKINLIKKEENNKEKDKEEIDKIKEKEKVIKNLNNEVEDKVFIEVD